MKSNSSYSLVLTGKLTEAKLYTELGQASHLTDVLRKQHKLEATWHPFLGGVVSVWYAGMQLWVQDWETLGVAE